MSALRRLVDVRDREAPDLIGSLPVTGTWLLLVYFLGKRQETLAQQQQGDILDR